MTSGAVEGKKKQRVAYHFTFVFKYKYKDYRQSCIFIGVKREKMRHRRQVHRKREGEIEV